MSQDQVVPRQVLGKGSFGEAWLVTCGSDAAVIKRFIPQVGARAHGRTRLQPCMRLRAAGWQPLPS